ncbi:protein EFFECTOR OF TRANSCRIPTION 2-like [Hibiscus syriacus]|nr:protein EFFECTOR OF TRANSCRIPTION 2-like [Hibiscus syriacus]
MGSARLADEVIRLNREDHKRTKHDTDFSKWKILIGPHDWEDHSMGKEGVTRYRVESLPKFSSSGLYELAIYRTNSSTRDHRGQLDPDKALVVYLGEADNVKTRLQQYGRAGAHLCGNGSADKVCGRFEDIFARGYSIAYRWAPKENKADARRTEAQLLNTYDYAWNKGSNGVRRHNDILQKLDKRASTNFSRKNLPLLQKQVGIKIKSSKLLSDDNEFSKHTHGESHNFLPLAFKFSRSQPRLVSDHGGSDKNDTITCGVVLEDGSICGRTPAKGKKQCAEHMGKKTKESSICGALTGKGTPCNRTVNENGRCWQHLNYSVSSSSGSSFTRHSNYGDSYTSICGVPTGKGTPCNRTVNGNGRCWQHLNYGVSSSSGSSSTRHYGGSYTSICGAPTGNGTPCSRTVHGNGMCWQHLNYSVSSSRGSSFTRHSNYGGSYTSICGAPTRKGTPCMRTVNGNGRCWQH